ncbi:MAG: 6,7-dimethyl-8-ribityllumazine synthase [Candidatus Peribacteraceae bacterium]|nr:6,7-dimethyl-8-ribityllumazine synthase [Candidatus Peribacteraceae bacterium]
MGMNDAPDFGKIAVDPAWNVVIVRSVWYDELTSQMAKDATDSLVAAGISAENIHIIDAPGSYELPLLCKQALLSGADACIAFGIVVQGETHHARLVSEQAAAGIMHVQLELMKPIVFEVIFVDTLEDARERATGKGAKGPLAAKTALTSLARLKDLH